MRCGRAGRRHRRAAMRRFLMIAGVVGSLAGLVSSPAPGSHAQGQPNKWATVQGRVIWDVKKAPAPKPQPIKLPGGKAPGGVLLDDTLLIHPKNQGIANVFVWIEPVPGGDLPIH